MRCISIFFGFVAVATSSDFAHAQSIILSCTGSLSTKVNGIASVQDETLEINLDTGQVKGILGSDEIVIHYKDSTTIGMSGPTLYGMMGSGIVNRVSGKLIFSAPWPLPPEGAQVAFILQCSPARQKF